SALIGGHKRAAAQLGKVDALPERARGEVLPVALGPALQVSHDVDALVLAFDAGRPVANDLHQVDETEWPIADRGRMLCRQARQGGAREIRVRAYEVEVEIDLCRHGRSPVLIGAGCDDAFAPTTAAEF